MASTHTLTSKRKLTLGELMIVNAAFALDFAALGSGSAGLVLKPVMKSLDVVLPGRLGQGKNRGLAVLGQRGLEDVERLAEIGDVG
jgi:hypothetical protein